MNLHPLKIVLAAVAFLASNPDAFGTGAGSCGAGDTSINNAVGNNVHRFGSRGTMAELGVTFSIGGTVLTASTTTSFSVGSDLQWSIDSATAFTGVFIRVEKAAGTFTHIPGSDLLGEAIFCTGIAGVLGLDHSTADEKTSVTGTSTFDAAGPATVDIVVVIDDALYTYAQFLLSLDQVAVPTESPVAAPVPVIVPTTTPVAAPTETPVAAPTETPVAVPTEAPIATPVPIIVPTAAPVAAPIVPVSVPSIAPAASPIAEPVAPPTKAPKVTIEPTTTPPLIVPTKSPKKMGMEMKGKKGKEGKEGKESKEGKKDMKGMKRHNLRY